MKKILLLFKRILDIPLNILKRIRTFFKLLGFLILTIFICFCKMARSISRYMDRNPKCTVLLLLLSLVLAGLLLYIDLNFVPSRKTLKTFGFFYFNLHELLCAGVFFFGILNLFLVVVGFFWCITKQYGEQKKVECYQTNTSINLKFYENEDSDKLSLDAENVYIHSWIDLECNDPPIPFPRNLKKVLIQDERLLKNFLDVAMTSLRWFWDKDQWGFVDDYLLSPFELYIVHHQRIESVLDIIRQNPIWKLEVVKTYPNFMFCKMRLVVQEENELYELIRKYENENYENDFS